MAVRSARFGGTDLGEERGKPSQWNDTFDAVADTIAFTYSDISTISHNTSTPTLKRTYTFNRAVDGVIFTATLREDNNTVAVMQLKKNGTTLTNSNMIPLSGTYNGSSFRAYSDGNLNVLGYASTDRVPVTVFLDVSFAVNDTLELYLWVPTAGTVSSYSRLIIGINNKSASGSGWLTAT